MPELPDITIYIEALKARIQGRELERLRLASPLLLRSVDPPIAAFMHKRITEIRRIGKQILFGFEENLFLIIHLMIAGRFQWKEQGAAVPKKIGLAAFDFDNGTLILTEAGSKKRASMYTARGEAPLKKFDRGALEVLDCTVEDFAATLRSENHTLKRSLTDPRLFSGIGNAYSDEILHRARLSPMKLTSRLNDDEVRRLFEATRATLLHWVEALRADSGGDFPSKVTAFRPGMAVHGRFGKPCPDCGAPVQRIVYAENECNYCVNCQTEGRLLADRAMSRLLREDWPRSLEELEALRNL
jgi:formamidopyrimidine-DNA glycosylase